MGVLYRGYPYERFANCDEGEPTETSIAQSRTEDRVLEVYQRYRTLEPEKLAR